MHGQQTHRDLHRPAHEQDPVGYRQDEAHNGQGAMRKESGDPPLHDVPPSDKDGEGGPDRRGRLQAEAGHGGEDLCDTPRSASRNERHHEGRGDVSRDRRDIPGILHRIRQQIQDVCRAPSGEGGCQGCDGILGRTDIRDRKGGPEAGRGIRTVGQRLRIQGYGGGEKVPFSGIHRLPSVGESFRAIPRSPQGGLRGRGTISASPSSCPLCGSPRLRCSRGRRIRFRVSRV